MLLLGGRKELFVCLFVWVFWISLMKGKSWSVFWRVSVVFREGKSGFCWVSF